MVATDVASRGIGMIENPLPNVQQRPAAQTSAPLSSLKLYLDCVIMSGSFRVLRFSNTRRLGSAVQHFRASLAWYIPNSKVLSLVHDVELTFLDLIKPISKTPKAEDQEV